MYMFYVSCECVCVCILVVVLFLFEKLAILKITDYNEDNIFARKKNQRPKKLWFNVSICFLSLSFMIAHSFKNVFFLFILLHFRLWLKCVLCCVATAAAIRVIQFSFIFLHLHLVCVRGCVLNFCCFSLHFIFPLIPPIMGLQKETKKGNKPKSNNLFMLYMCFSVVPIIFFFCCV